ncbi:MAG: hypothetical protein WDZ45_12280 [Flavobacteriaceae bacterium]
MTPSTNLETSLNKIRKRRISSQKETKPTLDEIKNELKTVNRFNLEKLDSNRIYYIEDIKSLCIDYRLRFLDFALFKGSIPSEAIDKIQNLEKDHQTDIQNLKIVAPSKMFRLKNADDPLLFAPLGNDFFYLIHKWGADLHPLRKYLMWPYKNFENLIFTIFLLSLFLTLLIPDGLFSKEQSLNQTFIVFLFMFKWVAAIVLFYGVALGKNFNNQMWNSKYFNG